MAKINISMAVAMTLERVIGRKNDLPWHLPSDLRRFRETTTTIGTVVLGRTTYESIIARNGKPLPKRQHIVLSRSHCIRPAENVTPVRSKEEALCEIRKLGGHACVIGGQQIYELFLPLAERIYCTLVHARIEGDAFFPELGTGWQLNTDSSPKVQEERDEYPTSIQEYERI